MAKRNLSLFPRLAYGENKVDTGLGYQYLGREGLQIVNNLIDRYRYYDGKHWVNEQGAELTPGDLKAANNLDYRPTMITVNMIAWFIDRLAAFMFEHSISVNCPIEQIDDSVAMASPDYTPSSEQIRADETAASRQWLLYRVIGQNLLNEKLLKAATDYHIGGGVCAKLHYDKNKGLRVIWRPRLEYWPVYNTDDIDDLEKIHFTAFVDDDTIWKQTYWMHNGSCWMEEALYDTQLKVKEVLVPAVDTELPFMPMEVFTRGGLTGETEGRSLVDTLKSLNDELNAKISDNSDSLRFGMFAIKVVLNAMLPDPEDIKEGKAQPLQIAPNALWALNGDGELPADAKTIEHNFNYKEALKDHLEMVMSLMHKLADVPNVSPDQVKGMGQMSGFALKLLYGSIISATNRSMIIWEPRLQRLLGKALYMLNKYETRNHYDQDWVKDADLGSILSGEIDSLVEVATQMPLPENEAELVDLQMKKVVATLESIKGAMDALGVENPEQKLAEILAEKTSIQEALGGVMDEPETNIDDNTGGGGNE